MFTSGYLCTIALILFIHVGFLEYLSFKQFKLIVKMTRIESGVTIPKGLFTLYLNVKKVTAKIFWPAIVQQNFVGVNWVGTVGGQIKLGHLTFNLCKSDH
jgi:hypothetical protein